MATIIDSLGRSWDPRKHPRDRKGRFIRTFSLVRLFLPNGTKAYAVGRIDGIDDNGRLKVSVTDINRKDNSGNLPKVDVGSKILADPANTEHLEARADLKAAANTTRLGALPLPNRILEKHGSDKEAYRAQVKDFASRVGFTDEESADFDALIDSDGTSAEHPTGRYIAALHAFDSFTSDDDFDPEEVEDFHQLMRNFGVSEDKFDESPDGATALEPIIEDYNKVSGRNDVVPTLLAREWKDDSGRHGFDSEGREVNISESKNEDGSISFEGDSATPADQVDTDPLRIDALDIGQWVDLDEDHTLDRVSENEYAVYNKNTGEPSSILTREQLDSEERDSLLDAAKAESDGSSDSETPAARQTTAEDVVADIEGVWDGSESTLDEGEYADFPGGHRLTNEGSRHVLRDSEEREIASIPSSNPSEADFNGAAARLAQSINDNPEATERVDAPEPDVEEIPDAPETDEVIPDEAPEPVATPEPVETPAAPQTAPTDASKVPAARLDRLETADLIAERNRLAPTVDSGKGAGGRRKRMARVDEILESRSENDDMEAQEFLDSTSTTEPATLPDPDTSVSEENNGNNEGTEGSLPETDRVDRGSADRAEADSGGEGDSGSDRDGSSPQLRVSGKDVTPVAVHPASERRRSALEEAGLPTPDLYELSPEDAGAFRDAISASKENNRFGASVYVYDEAEYAEMRLFVTDDGKSGIALKGDEIVSAFSAADTNYKGSVRSNMATVIDLGGRRADSFDTVLPDIYAQEGLVAVARIDWDDEYAPEGWDKNTFSKFNNGEPGVVFYGYDADKVGQPYDADSPEAHPDYDSAAARVQSFLDGDRDLQSPADPPVSTEPGISEIDPSEVTKDHILNIPNVGDVRINEIIDGPDGQKTFRVVRNDTRPFNYTPGAGQKVRIKDDYEPETSSRDVDPSSWIVGDILYDPNTDSRYIVESINANDGGELVEGDGIQTRQFNPETGQFDGPERTFKAQRNATEVRYTETDAPVERIEAARRNENAFDPAPDRIGTAPGMDPASISRRADEQRDMIRQIIDGDSLPFERTEPEALPGEKFAPTRQQQDIIDAVQSGLNTKVQAGAGSGKTSTIEALARREQLRDPNKGIIYIAFNKTVQTEAESRMPNNVEARTGHSLAHAWNRQQNPWMITKLGRGGIVNNREVATQLGIRNLGKLDAPDVAKGVMEAVGNYASSADDDLQDVHLPEFFDGLPQSDRDRALGWAQAAWNDINSPDGQLKVSHDHYRKLWALSRPDLSNGTGGNRKAGLLVIDESQDTPPVLAKVVADQQMQKVYVGDEAQAIYGFTGAIDFLAQAEADVQLPLNKSWRFGPQVADIGNRYLQQMGSSNRIVGGGPDSVIGEIEAPDAILVRSNAGMLDQIIGEMDKGRRVGVPKGTKADIISLIKSAEALRRGNKMSAANEHDDIAPYATWEDLNKASGNGDVKAGMIARIFESFDVNELNEYLNRLVDAGDGSNPVDRITRKDAPNGIVLDTPFSRDPNVKGMYDMLQETQLWKDGWRWAPTGNTISRGKNAGKPEKRVIYTGSGDPEQAYEDAMTKLRSFYADAGGAPEVTISTAHKSKGLEWKKVRIGDDFRGPTENPRTGELEMPDEDELKLAYVAVTRAEEQLDPGSLGWIFEYTDDNGGTPDAPERPRDDLDGRLEDLKEKIDDKDRAADVDAVEPAIDNTPDEDADLDEPALPDNIEPEDVADGQVIERHHDGGYTSHVSENSDGDVEITVTDPDGNEVEKFPFSGTPSDDDIEEITNDIIDTHRSENQEVITIDEPEASADGGDAGDGDTPEAPSTPDEPSEPEPTPDEPTAPERRARTRREIERELTDEQYDEVGTLTREEEARYYGNRQGGYDHDEAIDNARDGIQRESIDERFPAAGSLDNDELRQKVVQAKDLYQSLDDDHPDKPKVTAKYLEYTSEIIDRGGFDNLVAPDKPEREPLTREQIAEFNERNNFREYTSDDPDLDPSTLVKSTGNPVDTRGLSYMVDAEGEYRRYVGGPANDQKIRKGHYVMKRFANGKTFIGPVDKLPTHSQPNVTFLKYDANGNPVFNSENDKNRPGMQAYGMIHFDRLEPFYGWDEYGDPLTEAPEGYDPFNVDVRPPAIPTPRPRTPDAPQAPSPRVAPAPSGSGTHGLGPKGSQAVEAVDSGDVSGISSRALTRAANLGYIEKNSKGKWTLTDQGKAFIKGDEPDEPQGGTPAPTPPDDAPDAPGAEPSGPSAGVFGTFAMGPGPHRQTQLRGGNHRVTSTDTSGGGDESTFNTFKKRSKDFADTSPGDHFQTQSGSRIIVSEDGLVLMDSKGGYVGTVPLDTDYDDIFNRLETSFDGWDVREDDDLVDVSRNNVRAISLSQGMTAAEAQTMADRMSVVKVREHEVLLHRDEIDDNNAGDLQSAARSALANLSPFLDEMDTRFHITSQDPRGSILAEQSADSYAYVYPALPNVVNVTRTGISDAALENSLSFQGGNDFFMPAAQGRQGVYSRYEYLLTHEIGHSYDAMNGHTFDSAALAEGRLVPAQNARVFHATWSALLGRYGQSSVHEGYAEAFAQWNLGGPGSSEVADAYAMEYNWPAPALTGAAPAAGGGPA